MAQDPVPIDKVQARRIGFLADSHSAQPDGSDLPQAVLEALRGVDLIVHLGDMGAVGSLDRLATVAPVLATRGGHSIGQDSRIAPRARVIQAGVVAIGALFDLAALATGVSISEAGAPELPEGPLAPLLEGIFGRPVDVVAFAATHRPHISTREGVLFVNPGSPNLPASGPGTVAILELYRGRPGAQIREV